MGEREGGREREGRGGRKGREEREGREGGEGGRREREGEYTHTLEKQEESEGGRERERGRGREGTLFPGHTFLVSNTNSFPLRVATFPNESLGEKRIG